MHDTDDIGSSPAGNPHLDDVIEVLISRRRFIGGTVVAAATGFLGGSLTAASALRPVDGQAAGMPALTFKDVPPSSADTFS